MQLLKFFLFLLLVIFSGCTDEKPTEPNQNLFGLYKSSTFIEPGSLDAGVDIQQSGGYINIILKENYEFMAEIFIPDSISSNYAEGLSNYEGNYSLKSDTLEFVAQSFILSFLNWHKEINQLQSFDAPPRGQPFKIILNKN